MSSSDPVGIISSIIAIVNASVTIYRSVESIPDRLQSIRDQSLRLEVVLDTLKTVRANLKEENEGKNKIPTAISRRSLEMILNSCLQKALALQKAVGNVASTEGKSLGKLLQMVRLATRDDINKLANDMLLDLELLGINHSVNAATQEQVKDLAASLESRVLKSRESGGHRATEMYLYNSGLGSQYVFHGEADQNLALGGFQFNGTLPSSCYIVSTDTASLISGKTQAPPRVQNISEDTE